MVAMAGAVGTVVGGGAIPQDTQEPQAWRRLLCPDQMSPAFNLQPSIGTLKDLHPRSGVAGPLPG